ncbi:hypothetical protein SAMN05660659_04790 [Pseudomonas sp. LAMO17WK12:I6]|uniref:hypothetical protein n=1 Tax=unclassified Pseudomonas TaxID=196821 RepID=UPI000BC61101|nr:MULTISPECIES: hypothetical protein [unclassified Pseudomonas]SNY40105.1 hypothetical protein SAMN05660455_04563 [Pseudomonas sp. LAMO17WK12:I5]SNY43984.1 hypothetical protein SAMN05660659_04790 [Pseudomonas sp. LAMO17WK12:I6]
MSSKQTPQALRPPYLPALVNLSPAEHYDGGIPIRAVEGDLQGIIPAWLTMSVGDLAEVFWGNDQAAAWSKTLENDAELNQDLVFTIAKGQVLEGDATPVFYRITRKNQGAPEDSKPVMTLLVKLTRPGGYDDIPGDDGHSDLKFSLSHKEVDENLPPSGVTMHIVPYRNLTRYDRILARWGSQQVVHIVTPEQAQDPIRNSIEVVFSRAVIDAAGDGDRVAVAYQVIDRCGNYPDERAPWSATRELLVDLGGNRLDEPQVLVNGIPTDSIDLDQLGDDDVIARVYITKDDFAVGDKVLLTWIGTPAQGSQIIVGPLEKEVSYVPLQLDFPIPNAAVKAIAKGAASVGYVRRRSDESDRRSKNASVTVIGDISQLVAPTVDEAPGGTLPPETPWATVQIPWYPGRNSSDLLNLIWWAQAPGNDTVYYEDPRPVGNVADNQPVLRSVSNAEIQRFNGLNVKVYYVVTNSETGLLSVRESLPFMMQVGVALPTFDRPEVEGADANDVLDPDDVPPTGATLVVPYLGTRDKDRVNYRWRGSASGGSVSDHVDLIPATAGRPVRITVEKKYVTTNLNGTVVADYSIQRAGETLGHSHELTLRIGTALGELPPPFLVAPATDPIDVLAYPNGVTVRIEYPEALSGDQACLVEVDPPAGTPPFPLVEFDNKRVDTVLSPAFLAARHGKVIELRGNLYRNGGHAGQSDAIKVRLLKIIDEDPRLPTPNIDGNTSKELSVQDLTTDARILAERWPLFEPGQPIWATCRGFDKNGEPITNDVRSGEPNDSPDGLSLAAPIEWLKELKDGTELTISVKVNLDGIASELTATACPPRIYSLRGTQRDENFDNVPPQLIGPLETLDTGAISIINQSSTGSLKIVTFNRDSASGAIEGNVLINESAVTKFRIELKAPVQRLSFHYADVQATQGKILFYGPDGYIDERPLISSAGISQLIFSAANINYIEFYNGGEEQVIFDNFMFN